MVSALTLPAPAQSPPAAAPDASKPAAVTVRPFVRPNVPVALFTHEKTALLPPECERIATFLARYAAERLTERVLSGEAAARAQGRLLLTISWHLQPMNPAAVHCATRWFDGKPPGLPPHGENVRTFSNFLLTAASRQKDKPGPAREALARILIRLAADIDPENEEAVYASELQDGNGNAPPMRELLEGTLGNGW